MLNGTAQGDSPAPDTLAFFNSLKLVDGIRMRRSMTSNPFTKWAKAWNCAANSTGKSSTRVYPVKLAAGKNYVIDMVSPDQKTLDPYLVLTDGTGKSLAEDDDSGGGLNARIVFRPEQAGHLPHPGDINQFRRRRLHPDRA